MTDQQATVDMQNSLTFGQRLISCREALGLDRKEAASQLRLPERIIIMLESDEIEPNLPTTFLRGYIRSYGKFLAISEQEVQAALAMLAPQPASHEAANVAATETPTRATAAGETSARLANLFLGMFKYLIGFALIVLIGVSLFTYKANAPHQTAVATIHNTADATTDASATPIEDASLSTGLPGIAGVPMAVVQQAKSWLPAAMDSKKMASTVLLTVAGMLLFYLFSLFLFQTTNTNNARAQQNLFIKQAANNKGILGKCLFLLALLVLAGLVFLGFNHNKQDSMPVVAHTQNPAALSQARQPAVQLVAALPSLSSPSLHQQLAASFKTYALSSLVNQLNSYLVEAAAVKVALADPATKKRRWSVHPQAVHYASYQPRKYYDNTIPPYYRYDHPSA